MRVNQRKRRIFTSEGENMRQMRMRRRMRAPKVRTMGAGMTLKGAAYSSGAVVGNVGSALKDFGGHMKVFKKKR